MNKETQMKILDDTVAEIKDLLYNKGKEYAHSEDVLANFKRGSALGITAKQKLGVFLEKHMAAIWSYIANGKVYSEHINGRINDAINYLIFLKDLIHEEENNPEFARQQEEILKGKRSGLSELLKKVKENSSEKPCPKTTHHANVGGQHGEERSYGKEFG